MWWLLHSLRGVPLSCALMCAHASFVTRSKSGKKGKFPVKGVHSYFERNMGMYYSHKTKLAACTRDDTCISCRNFSRLHNWRGVLEIWGGAWGSSGEGGRLIVGCSPRILEIWSLTVCCCVLMTRSRRYPCVLSRKMCCECCYQVFWMFVYKTKIFVCISFASRQNFTASSVLLGSPDY